MPFAFIHIPKTAGRAFAGSITIHTEVSVAPHLLMGHYYTIPIGNYDFYRGHTFLCAMEEIMPEGTKFMTLLRDPINRIYSHWNHITENMNWRLYGVDRPLTFSQFIRHTNTRNLASNYQLRYLTLCPDPKTLMDDILLWQLRLEQERPMGYKWQDMFVDVVLEKLDRFAMVGTQENFGSSVMCACLAMGYNPPPWVKTVGKNYYDLISQEDLEYLMPRNEADWRIYNEYK